MKFLKLVLVLALFFINTWAFASSEVITIISDAHISADKQNNSMTPSIQKLLNAVDIINKSSSNAVVFLGDNIQSQDKINAVMFAKIAKKLKKPYYIVPGNRDISKSKDLTKENYYKIVNKFSSNKIKTVPSYKKYGDLIFVFMSGVNETFPTYKGYYKADELSFLDKTLTKFQDKKIIIFQHFPVVMPKEDSTRVTYKPELYLDILKNHKNVLAIVSGHYHTENIQNIDGIKHISVGALGQSGEFEQIKIFKNKDNTYTLAVKILNVK